MGPIGYVIGAVLVLGGAALGARYYKKHRHVDGCPTYAQVQKAVADVDGNVVSLDAARATANTWERSGCQPATDALRAVILLSVQKEAALKAPEGEGKLVPAIVNWIPGCIAPAAFVPPATWTPGSPGVAIPAGAESAGWMPPDGWKVGDALPAGYPCPPGWVKSGGSGSGGDKLDLATKGHGSYVGAARRRLLARAGR